ncbi:hypothetical protein [Corallococcus llansteffanensis]|uniref:Uncharacterized protein n=1 Tax=Corallococcus llansteffanensis TaxID=2316731 RepID=A0A3A8QI46_9BACT|nr:hypothetical protein [Corallococcus llansteffanensis]RKH68409.1 hypothetical protein D7V93_01350 [Corallococcus llansteffanensis]
MGLAERRAAKKFEDTVYPKLKQQLDAAAHHEVQVEVNWQSLAIDGSADLYEEAFTKVYFTPLIEAFEAICIDDMGREALQSKLKRVVIRNTADVSSGSSMVTFEDGVLTLDHRPTTNIDDIRERKNSIQQTLEAAL